MTYKELVLTVRPEAVEKMGGIINKNRRVIGHNWQSAFEALLPAEQAEARVRQVYPPAKVAIFPEWDDDGGRGYAIHTGFERLSLIFDTPESAWLDAERNLK